MKESNSIIKLAFIVVLSFLLVFVPGAKETISGVFESSENFQPIYVNVGDLNLKWDVKFDFPEFQFDTQEFSVPTLSLNPIVLLIIAFGAVILAGVSYKIPSFSLILTVLVSALGFYFSGQTVDVYKNMLANGSTFLDAAGACFGVLFWLYFVVLAIGLLGISSTVMEDQFDNDIYRGVFGAFIAAALAAVGALVASGLCWVILGLGWAGGVYVSLLISFVVAMVGEWINGSFQFGSDSSEPSFQNNELENYYYDYDEDYE